MTELAMQRVPRVPGLYTLPGVRSTRLEGLTKRRATVEAAGRRYGFRCGMSGVRVRVLDEQGAQVGSFEPRGPGRGGPLRIDGRELDLKRRIGLGRTRYVLADGERPLATLENRV